MGSDGVARRQDGVKTPQFKVRSSPRFGNCDLPLPVNNPPLRKVIRRKLNSHLIARYDADEMLPHPASHVRHHDVSTLDFHAEPSVGEGLRHNAFDLERFFLLFCHTFFACVVVSRPGLRRIARQNRRLSRRYNPIILASLGCAGPASLRVPGGNGRSCPLAGSLSGCIDNSGRKSLRPCAS